MSGIEAAVASRLDAEVVASRPLSGGMVGEVHRVDLADGRSVVAKRSPTPLSVEAGMLSYLGERGLPVPAVLAADDECLVLSYVPGGTGDPTPDGERAVADALAALHEHTAPAFGFERDTLLGPLALPNPWTESWIEFVREHRLRHFATVALERGAVDERAVERVDALAADLDAVLVEPDAPALLHGDVWRENVLLRGDAPVFLDPACYYGAPEEELAYVRWSDAFGDAFRERYRERVGIEPGFEERCRVYAVPRLLVHATCFGEPYPRELAATLDDLGY